MKNKTITIVLAFTLGGFGVHRFYLGQKKKGLWYLLFCWTLIPMVIGFIEGVLFFSMSYSLFNQTYNIGRTFKKKFEDDEAILQFNTDEKLEKAFLQKLENMQNPETIKAYMLEAKARGEYLPRSAYAKARLILSNKKNNHRLLDMQ